MRTVCPPKSWQTDLAEHPFIALQDPWYRLLALLGDGITRATLDFFSRQGLRSLHFPMTTASISSPMGLGSDSEPVPVTLCGISTYLADSMQFFLEYGCRLTGTGTFYLQPSFRGENADARHLCQFYHAEAEIIGTLDDVIALVEAYLRALTERLAAEFEAEISAAAGTLSHIHRLLDIRAFPSIEVEEVLAGFGQDPDCVVRSEHGFSTITTAGERKILSQLGPFIWLRHPHHMSVPFYQAFSPANGRHAACADLLMGIGETVGAGQRHSRAEDAAQALALHGVERTPYDWYLTMKERYPLNTSGFGLGIERYLCWLLQHDDIRDMQIVPRFNGIAHSF